MQEHFNNLNSIINLKEINNILDSGSGRTSLNYLINTFPNANIDAVVFPGDYRKINSIKENVQGTYNLIETDLCKNNVSKEYDLVLAHLLLGEATKFNNTFEDLLEKLLKIKSTYYVIYDFKEDNTLDFNYLESYLQNNNFEIIDKKEFPKQEPQQFTNFLGSTYIAYLIKHK